jgi:D-alanyl-D-alanine dipeptidase
LWSATLCSAEETRIQEEQLVDISQVCVGVVVELRYAAAGNITGAPIYPKNARALIRHNTAQRLIHAQRILGAEGYGLKIWDAYRPSFAHEALWFARPYPEFVADPAKGGSLHEWGVAVDVTLIDLKTGKDAAMPTDFDQFGPAAARRYQGGNPIVAANLTALQKAMVAAGFLTMRDEWWHFVDKDFQRYGRVIPPPLLSPDPRG